MRLLRRLYCELFYHDRVTSVDGRTYCLRCGYRRKGEPA